MRTYATLLFCIILIQLTSLSACNTYEQYPPVGYYGSYDLESPYADTFIGGQCDEAGCIFADKSYFQELGNSPWIQWYNVWAPLGSYRYSSITLTAEWNDRPPFPDEHKIGGLAGQSLAIAGACNPTSGICEVCFSAEQPALNVLTMVERILPNGTQAYCYHKEEEVSCPQLYANILELRRQVDSCDGSPPYLGDYVVHPEDQCTVHPLGTDSLINECIQGCCKPIAFRNDAGDLTALSDAFTAFNQAHCSKISDDPSACNPFAPPGEIRPPSEWRGICNPSTNRCVAIDIAPASSSSSSGSSSGGTSSGSGSSASSGWGGSCSGPGECSDGVCLPYSSSSSGICSPTASSL